MSKKKSSLLTVQNFFTTCVSLGLNPLSNKSLNIWLGFSGGLDSRVLLELTKLAFKDYNNYKLIAVHINHSVNKNADIWQEHCYQTCKKLAIEFRAIKIIPDAEKINALGSLEAALRLSRIEVWQNLVLENDILLLAHHLNDQVETVFLRLLRGSGLAGLAAIRPATIINKVKIIRPLLVNSREQIEYFAKQNNLAYIQDDSNLDQNFSRNFVRHTILPQLSIKWPNLIVNINRAVKHLQQADFFIIKQAQVALANCYVYENYINEDLYNNHFCKNILSISRLLQYDKFLQTEILRKFITNQGFYPPDQDKLLKIYFEVINAKIDRQPILNLHQYIICRYRDKLYSYPASYLKRRKPSFKNIIGDLAIYVGDSISNVSLKKAKKIFQKFGIPPWMRYDYPLVFRGKNLIAIIGLWCKGL